ncbi:hypothetical protein SAMN05216351_10981 [Pseudobutyrivibrio sp. JW11]|uniref:hypothetical protein n=1 Tax=Pseudobutyrivibrio sp. JW11 TaxID=1855302 RepID=UPI0008E14BB8|nr:hypothetical protein [Pseudobutyrivibrio sp. JW11]SFO42234.1 hypothetical protein SAMN05216351_10981 [Pseudobutyrivibrio sp. JW11]
MMRNKTIIVSLISIIMLTSCGKPESVHKEAEDNNFKENVVTENNQQEDVQEEVVEDNATKSFKDYFYADEDNEYTYKVIEFLDEDVSEVSVEVKKLDEYDNGNVYAVNIEYDDCPGRYYWGTSDRFNIGTFYVTEESIYVLFDRTDTPTEEDFIESGYIICSQDMEQNVDGQLTRITNDGDTCTCLLSNTLTESGFYSEYEWTKGKGLTYFRSGYGAEGEPIEIKMQNE